MNEAMHALFDQVRAEEALKERTQTALFRKARRYRARRRMMAAAAACLTAVILAGGSWAYFTPTVEISIDINPSIELGVNRFDKVVSVCGRNEDGEALAEELDVVYLDCTEALQRILDDETVTALLAEDGAVSIGVIGQEGAQATRLLEDLRSCAQSCGEDARCYFAHRQEVEPAHDLGLSYGKYKALLEAQAIDPTMTADRIRDMTMGEVRDWMACQQGSCGATGQQFHAQDCDGSGQTESTGSQGWGQTKDPLQSAESDPSQTVSGGEGWGSAQKHRSQEETSGKNDQESGHHGTGCP